MRSKHVSVVITAITSTALLAATLLTAAVPASFGLVNSPPSLFIGAQPTSQTVQAGGGSANFTVDVYPQGDWKTGTISFSLVDPPKGVTATFNPAKLVDVDLGGGSTIMTVSTTADVQGTLKLTIKSEGKATPNAGGVDMPVDASTDVTLTVGGNTQPTNTTTTTTTTKSNTTTTTATNSSTTTTTSANSVSTVTSLITSTLTTTTTSTVTVISTERANQTQSAGATGLNPAANSSYIVFGIGALTISSILFISGVLLLASNRKHT